MNTSIVGKNIELSEAIKNYAESAFEAIKKYNLDIISANIVVSEDKKGMFIAEYVINVKDKHTVVITQKEKDLYAAIDIALERAKKNLRRYADKIKDNNNGSIKNLEITGDNDIMAEVEEDDIIALEPKLYKPLDFEEAKEMLDESGENFFVFYDIDENLRVLTKLDNGKHGLY
ncbi:MAG TPA: ribosome-associated translation inhibitor RaiA [Nitratifractor sp.]|nr:ribosome-associated translation inhibitor RaiA [Nitratifractor sp.]HHD74663.1 ribosome-associated translation inhibitor RaiA [Nitratifractor sp.]HHH20746.1 ribosome-associated translation inhibitor RaiA [Nitratifractor sp.]